jgi:hypothetical protein
LGTLVIPGLPWCAVTLLLIGAVLFLLAASPLALGLLVFIAFPTCKLLHLYLDWLAYSIVAVAGSTVLTERSGILTERERLIPLATFSTVEYERPKWASWLGLDFGDIQINAIGGPFVLRTMGGSADLWRVIKSRGQEVPPKRPSALYTLSAWLRRSVRSAGRRTAASLALLLSGLAHAGRAACCQSANSFRALLPLARRRRRATPQVEPDHGSQPMATLQRSPGRAMARQRSRRNRLRIAADSNYMYKGTPFSQHSASRAGLYAFAEQFILTGQWTPWVYHASDPGRQYYPKGISEQVARFYLDQLRQKSILITVNGRERLSSRIRSIRDIQRLIPDLRGPLGKAA